MQSKVQVVPDDLGNVIRVSKNNPEYAHVRIIQEKVGFTANGWVKKTTLSTLIHGTAVDLEAIGIAKKKTLPGKIVVKESLNPFSTSNPDRDLKIAGDTGVICVSEDQPIYRKTFYVLNDKDEDVLIPHTNKEEIVEAQSGGTNNLENLTSTQNIDANELSNIQDQIVDEDNETEIEEETEEVVDEVKEEESFEL